MTSSSVGSSDLNQTNVSYQLYSRKREASRRRQLARSSQTSGAKTWQREKSPTTGKERTRDPRLPAHKPVADRAMESLTSRFPPTCAQTSAWGAERRRSPMTFLPGANLTCVSGAVAFMPTDTKKPGTYTPHNAAVSTKDRRDCRRPFARRGRAPHEPHSSTGPSKGLRVATPRLQKGRTSYDVRVACGGRSNERLFDE